MSNDSFFEPITQAHSIAEVISFFEFSPDLAEVAPSFVSIQEDLKEKFPRAQRTQLFKFEVRESAQASVSPALAGLQMSRHRTDGSMEWMINITLPAISFHCMNYSRWNSVWPEMQTYIGRVLRLLTTTPTSSPILIIGIGFKYVDRFTWKGPGSYDATKLFKKNNEFLHPRAFTSGQRWHCHTGWFQQDDLKKDILNQLNIDSGEQPLSEKTQIIVNIDHTQTSRNFSQQEASLAQYAATAENSNGPINKLMQRFHVENRTVLSTLLSEEVAQRIKLQGAAAL